MGLFLNHEILEGNSNYFKLALKKINPDKLTSVRSCLDIVEKTGMININDDYSITVENSSKEFVQQVKEMSKIIPKWTEVGAMISSQPKHIVADEGSAADFIYQSICVVTSQAHASSFFQAITKIIELARTVNVKIAGPAVQRFEEISHVAPKTMVLWSDPNLVNSTALGRLLIMFPETTCVCIVQFRNNLMFTESARSRLSAWSLLSVPVMDIEFSHDNFQTVTKGISKAVGFDFLANPALHVVVTAGGAIKTATSLLSKISMNFCEKHQVCVFMREENNDCPSADYEVVTRDFLLSCGEKHALIPKQMWSRLTLDPSVDQYLAVFFYCRKHRLRIASVNDVSSLCALEHDSVPPQVRLSSDRISTQMKTFAEGQYVITIKDQIVAVLYTFQVDSSSLRGPLTREGQPLLHNVSSADSILLVALRVHPDYRNQKAAVGTDLLGWVQLVARTHSFSNVFGITRTRDFVRRSCPEISMTDYVHAGTDPLIQYHVKNGATVVKVVDNFWESDVDNDGAGVLIVYEVNGDDLSIRSSQDARCVTTLKPYFQQLVREIAIEAGCDETINSDISLMDAGLDPLHAAKFREILSKKLCNLCLPETLIFDYPSIEKIADMLTRCSATLPYLQQLVRDIAIEAGCVETIECDFPLMDAGLDSLDAINFRSLLSRTLCNTWVPETIIFDYPTIGKIAEMLAGHTREISFPQSIYPASASSTSIAIVGVGCRFPNNCADLASFSELLTSQTCTVSDVPLSRWNAFGRTSRSVEVKRGHFLQVF